MLLILETYVNVVLGITGFIHTHTGLYPAEQLSIARNLAGAPQSAGIIDTITTSN